MNRGLGLVAGLAVLAPACLAARVVLRYLPLHGERWTLALMVAALVGLPHGPAGRADGPTGLHVEGHRFRLGDGAEAVRGILLKPEGKGPFPAVLISHGMGGNAERFGLSKAREFVTWGFVCIAPDYTHSDPQGDRSTFGAGAENLRRARTCLDILTSLPEVDAKRVCAYGNSMGAFLTVGLAAEVPDRLAAAAITAGGVAATSGYAAPSRDRAARITTPFCILHGTADTTVPPERSALLEEVLRGKKVACERHLFAGVGHDLHAAKAREVNAKIEAWFRKHTARK